MKRLFSKMKHYVLLDDFYDKVKEQAQQMEKNNVKIALATIDIDHFNYVNDLLGFETGDLILQKVAEFLSNTLNENEYFTRLHADIFAVCVSAEKEEDFPELLSKLSNFKDVFEEILPSGYNLITSGGAIILQETPALVSAVLDKANYARQKAKNTSENKVFFYDNQMNEELQWQKSVTFSMESALENREFEMYLQPKIAIKEEQITGAEALVRWNHPRQGLIAPNRFIPIIEQSGFIQKLDFFMLEEACLFLKKCAETGIPQLPISVNFSKAHLTNKNLADQVFQTVNGIGIDTSMIEIEFTESVFIDGFDRLIELVSDLKLLGFRVSLDDFGSAYSSLNCLKELPIDIIKIDKGFLQDSANTEKGKLIIAKVVGMIKSLRMVSIMEGVETGEQLEFLRKLSCDFAQGYFFAKPMKVDDYVEYLRNGVVFDVHKQRKKENEDIGLNLYGVPQEFQIDNWELYTLGKNIDMGLMKGYLDGEATIQYINDRALEYLGYTRQEFREKFHNSILAFTHPDDAHIVQKNIEQLITTGKPLEFQTRAIRKDGKVVHLQGRSSCVVDDRGRPIGLHAFQDVTAELARIELLKTSLINKIEELEKTVQSEREARESLYLSEERYRVVVEQSDDIMFDWDFATDTVTFSPKYTELFDSPFICKNPRTNEELHASVHPKNAKAFEKWLEDTYRDGGHHQVEFRKKDVSGEYIWLKCNSTVIYDSDGKPLRAVGLLANIDSQKCQLAALTYKSQRDPLTKVLNKAEMQLQVQSLIEASPEITGAFFMIDIDNFKALNDNLGHQLGDTVLVELSEKLKQVFPKGVLAGRMGGDEFGVYVQEVDYQEVCSYAEALVGALHLNYYGAIEKYSVSASVGVALYPACAKEFEDLYYRADIALYEAKRSGKDCYTIYKDGMTGILFSNRTPVEWSEGFLNAYFQEDFPFRVFEMLYETKDLNASVSMVLKLLGEHFQMDRVYIFQNDEHSAFCSNIYEWCAKNIHPEKENLQRVALSDLSVYLHEYSIEGVYSCPDIRKAPKEVYDICAPQGIKSMLHCAIHNEGNPVGFIGFDMCTTYHDWTGEEIAILGYISRILSVFLLKADIALELKSTYQNYVEMVKNLSGFVYVVDPKTFEVLYVNDATQSLGVDDQSPCYKMAFGADKPCVNCPMKHFSDTVHYATEEIYSVLLQKWVSSTASKITWEGNRDAGLICCTDISKYKKGSPDNM